MVYTCNTAAGIFSVSLDFAATGRTLRKSALGTFLGVLVATFGSTLCLTALGAQRNVFTGFLDNLVYFAATGSTFCQSALGAFLGILRTALGRSLDLTADFAEDGS